MMCIGKDMHAHFCHVTMIGVLFLCWISTKNALSQDVTWTVGTSVPRFFEDLRLNCTVDSFCCTTFSRIWETGSGQKILYDGVSTSPEKYVEEWNGATSGFTLIIKNLQLSDVEVEYNCLYRLGIDKHTLAQDATWEYPPAEQCQVTFGMDVFTYNVARSAPYPSVFASVGGKTWSSGLTSAVTTLNENNENWFYSLTVTLNIEALCKEENDQGFTLSVVTGTRTTEVCRDLYLCDSVCLGCFIMNPITWTIIVVVIQILILLWWCYNMQKGEMKKRGFSFVLSSTNLLKVAVKPPERLHLKKKVHNDWLGSKRYYEAKQSLHMIHTINELDQTNLTVGNETQSQNTFNFDAWITISFPLQSNALAVVHVQQGAQMCSVAGYEHKLLGFIKHGIMKSMKDNMEYVIPVTVEKRRDNNEEWSQIDQTEVQNQIPNFHMTTHLIKTLSEIRSMRLTLVRNLFKIEQKTNLIKHVEDAIEKTLLEEIGFHTFATKIPVISTFFGVYFEAVRAGKGDIAGAIEDILSGILADIPVVGTTLSLSADTVILVRDIANEMKKNEKSITHLTDKDIKDLKEENKKIISKIKEVQPDSQVFGDKSSCLVSDESYIEYTDDISKIHIKSNDFIVCIQIEYRFGGKTACLGGNEGTFKTMVLEVNEKITSVQVSSYNNVLRSLKFHTDMGKEEKFGNEGENVMSYELTNGQYIGGIKVCIGDFMVDNMFENRRIVRAISFTAKF